MRFCDKPATVAVGCVQVDWRENKSGGKKVRRSSDDGEREKHSASLTQCIQPKQWETALSGGEKLAVYFTGRADDDERRGWAERLFRAVGRWVLAPTLPGMAAGFVRLTDAEKWSSRPSTPERSRWSLFETNYSTSGCDGPTVRPFAGRPAGFQTIVQCPVDRRRGVRSPSLAAGGRRYRTVLRPSRRRRLRRILLLARRANWTPTHDARTAQRRQLNQFWRNFFRRHRPMVFKSFPECKLAIRYTRRVTSRVF